MDKKQRYATLTLLFFCMMALPFLFIVLHDHFVGPLRSLVVDLLCLGSIVFGGLGWIVSILLRPRMFKPERESEAGSAAQHVKMPDTDTPIWRVTDPSKRADLWRCQMVLIVGRWQYALAVFSTPVVFAGIFGLPFALARSSLTVYIIGGVFAAWLLFLAGAITKRMFRHHPTAQAVRVTETTLTKMGFEDIAPDKSVFFPWTEVVEIREVGGDLYLWRTENKGYYITRNAFRDRQAARAFAAKANELWEHPVPMPDPEAVPAAAYAADVWPPPPRA